MIALSSMALLALLAAPAGPCDVSGVVRDGQGQPVAGIEVQLDEGAAPRITATDAEGRFRFATVPQDTRVVVTLRDGSPTPRFVIEALGTPVFTQAEVGPGLQCEVELSPGEDPSLPDRLAIFQATRRGFAMMEQLGIRPTTTLTIEVDDTIASPDAAYWVGPPSYNPDDTTDPRIVLGTIASTSDDRGAPDNREYHELGHHALATAFGALPRSRDNLDHGDYHRNPSSAAAWTEGFAIFFAALVAREIDQRPDPWRYRVGGADLDLELDYRAWDLRGRESVAVAGLLWDLVDGPRQGTEQALEISAPAVLTEAGVPYLLVGRVTNDGAAPLDRLRVQARGADWTGFAPVAPRTLEPGAVGWFALPLPDAIGSADPLAALTLRAATAFEHADDDPFTLQPAAVWRAIAELRSERDQSNGRLFDVVDLYQALRGRFGGKDDDGDGVDDIDALFVAHGLFADLDGDHERAPNERLGLTSHPARTLTVDGEPRTWPAIAPRHRLTMPPASWVNARTEPADADLIVVSPPSELGGYVVDLDHESAFVLIPPPATPHDTVTVIAGSPDRRPTVLYHRSAVEFLDELERHEAPHLAIGTKLPPWQDAAATMTPERWPRLVFISGAIAALLGLLLTVIGWPRLR